MVALLVLSVEYIYTNFWQRGSILVASNNNTKKISIMNSKTIISNLETDIDNDCLDFCYFRGQRATNSLESPTCLVEILEVYDKIEDITVTNYGYSDPDEHRVYGKELSDKTITFILRTANMEDRIERYLERVSQ